MFKGIILAIYILMPLSFSELKAESSAWLCRHSFSPAPVGLNERPIVDLNSFAYWMNRGMVLKPEQGSLFDLYRKIYMGDPIHRNEVVKSNLASTYGHLDRFPDVKRIDFPALEVSSKLVTKEKPKLLLDFISSQIKIATNLKGKLFHPLKSSSQSYWKDLLQYSGSDLISFIQKSLGDKLLAELNNESISEKQKLASLFTRLSEIKTYYLEQNYKPTKISQALVDIPIIAAFHEVLFRDSLNVSSPEQVIQNFGRLNSYADSFLITELNFKKGFEDLQTSEGSNKKGRVQARKSSLEQSVGSYKIQIDKLNRALVEAASSSKSSYIVRELSLMERGFRGCLSKDDCSTREYFAMAYHPSYHYFTMTNHNNRSEGQATIVIGTAKKGFWLSKEEQKVALLDKVQGIPKERLTEFLTSIALALKQEGYELVLADNVLGFQKFSNDSTLVSAMQYEILPQLTTKLDSFSIYSKEATIAIHSYSNADTTYKVRVFDPAKFSVVNSVERKLLPANKHWVYEKEISASQLIAEYMKLGNSSKQEDLISFLSMVRDAKDLEKQGLLNAEEVYKQVRNILEDKRNSLHVRKQALYSFLHIDTNLMQYILLGNSSKTFSSSEISVIISEISDWKKIKDDIKNKFAEQGFELTNSEYGTPIVSLFALNLRAETIEKIKQHNLDMRVAGFAYSLYQEMKSQNFSQASYEFLANKMTEAKSSVSELQELVVSQSSPEILGELQKLKVFQLDSTKATAAIMADTNIDSAREKLKSFQGDFSSLNFILSLVENNNPEIVSEFVDHYKGDWSNQKIIEKLARNSSDKVISIIAPRYTGNRKSANIAVEIAQNPHLDAVKALEQYYEGSWDYYPVESGIQSNPNPEVREFLRSL